MSGDGSANQLSNFNIAAIELLGIIGYSCFIGWFLLTFFWLFADYPIGVSDAAKDFTQFWAFAGLSAGFVALHFLGQRVKFNLFNMPSLAFCVGGCCLLSVVVVAGYEGAHIPFSVTCIFNFLAGAAASGIQVAWLDVCGRLDTTKYGRFVGLSFAGGTLLFALVALAPFVMQALISFALLIMCIGLLAFCSSHAPLTNITWHESETASVWVFAKEIEPLFFMFGLSFALVFVYLFNKGGQDVLAGLVAIIPGGVVAAALSMYSKELGITTIERILMVCIVVGDVLLPFASDFFQLVIAVIFVALWAFFMTVNQAFIVKKCVLEGTAPLFRQGPIRLLPAAGGFAVGWAVATVFTHFMDDAQLDMFLYMSLGAAVLIVIVAMVFLPAESHHPVDGSAGAQVTPSANLESDACDHNCAACPTAAIAEELSQKAASTSKDEADMFDLKCQAVAKLYQLSPREAEVLKFLAKGRNASFIQEELTISPHTVKSHIYNIYRKLDIHSQQKLMSFVEEFTI